MIPTKFKECNCIFRKPTELDESQCADIPAYKGTIKEGNMDGSAVVVVAWIPDKEDLDLLNKGGMIYLSMIGGLAPHFLTTLFPYATT